MKRSDFLSVAILFVGVVVAFGGLYSIPQAATKIHWYSTVRTAGDSPHLLSAARWVIECSYPAIYLSAAAVLLLYGEAIAKKLVRHDRAVEWTPSGRWEKTFFVLAIRVIGVYYFVSYLPHVFSSFLTHLTAQGESARRALEPARLIGGILVMAASIYLIAGAQRLVRALYWGSDEHHETSQGEPR